MVPIQKVKEIISKHNNLEKELASGNLNSKNFSDYFSGIVAFENRRNSESLNFFESSKILLSQHDSFLQKYVASLVLENKIFTLNLKSENLNKTLYALFFFIICLSWNPKAVYHEDLGSLPLYRALEKFPNYYKSLYEIQMFRQ